MTSKDSTDSPGDGLVRHTALLARLSLGEGEAERLGVDFGRILAAFGSLAALDIGEARAMVRAGDEEGEPRADEPEESLPPDAILRAAPAREEDFYRVPKTLGGTS